MEKKPIINLKQHIRNPIKRKKKNKVKCSKPTESQKKKETKTQYTRLQPNLKKPEHEQQIHQVKQNHLSKKKKKAKPEQLNDNNQRQRKPQVLCKSDSVTLQQPHPEQSTARSEIPGAEPR